MEQLIDEFKTHVDEFKKHAVALAEHLQKLPKSQRVVTDNQPLVTEGQETLLGALGFVLEVWREFDRKTAESVEIDLGLLPFLRDLKVGQSIILTSDCPNGFQVEMKRLAQKTEPSAPILCRWCLNPNPPPKWLCCATYSRPKSI